MTTDLFSPVTLGSLALKNRMVMAPLTRNRAGEGGVPHDLNVTYYAQRATAGLIVTEATPISAMAHGYPALPGIYTDVQVAGWKKVTDAVHAKGGKIVLQLWHVGRISHPSLLPNGALPVAPSAIQPAGQAFTYTGLQDYVTPRALNANELPAIVQDYVHATKCALAAGFDGVEIHAANGYLLDQFLRDGSNQRTDNYGGSFENRAQLLLEVTKAVVGVAGADKVGIRLSPVNPFNDMHDSNPQALFNYVADALNQFNLAYLHVVEGGMGGEVQTFDFSELRKHFNNTYMANLAYDKARGNAAIASGHADCIAYGVPFLANPDLVARYKTNAPLNEADGKTFYGGDAKGYTDYPFFERAKIMQKPAITQLPINETIAKRWSGRAYDARKTVSHEQIIALLEAARWAPSCFGDEPWRFIVWNKNADANAWQHAFDCVVPSNQTWVKDAPVLVLVCAGTLFGHNQSPNRWAQYDTGAAAENLCLQAASMGLMAHQMGGFNADKTRESFSIPAEYTPMAMVTVGFEGDANNLPDELKARELAARKRKPLSELFFSETWGKSI